ncbi:hypothetical protein PHLGIDRAFT_311507 [Phlebiopsis gigantea 11061_1 CR5-6]|uniref:Dolichol phosphate-mannose biosynthesis regulatory protein n=1 Tax=Phlebiopsis gigantea (strain 11061_1 CR5-6) TaxID=745531 RepID=A0A0C3SDC7_PHLG1|nr:hypothetical protein PHLGIDRAFT_311507 [Phlebiopsis gigantea 11061_1 CR5-6]
MGLSDKTLGAFMLSSAAIIFAYYTVWTILLPFFDASSPVHGWFPSREWAVRIPAFILVVGISAIGTFIGIKVVREDGMTRVLASMKTSSTSK